MVQRLRFLDDEVPDFVGDSAELLLRLKLKPDSMRLVNDLARYELFDPRHDHLCFNFDLSFYAHEEIESTINDSSVNKLIRADWVGTQKSSGKFDVTKPITVVLEYEKSLSQHAPVITSNYADIYLQPITKKGNDATDKKKVYPSSFKLKNKEDAVLLLFFSADSMEKGQCYQLRFQFTSVLA